MRIVWIVVCLFVAAGGVWAQDEAPRTDRVLTRAEQAALTPAEVLRLLELGNERFVAGTITRRNHSAQVRAAVAGQFPMGIILSCVDSRVPAADVFDLGIGDVFVARVAGNFENTDILGSMEYATKISGAKLVLVMGHEDCGAIKSAIDGAELGNITEMLSNIAPAVEALSSYPGDRTSKNPEFVQLVAEKNVALTLERIRARSPILRGMEARGEIAIVGAMYDMKTGEVELLD